MAMASIKDQFNRDAAEATTQGALGQALQAAATTSAAKLTEIDEALTAAVADSGAGAYDLSDARARIETALAAGRAEVRLNHARQSSMMEARDFELALNTALAAATSEAEVQELLEGAYAFAIDAETALDGQLEEILDEARADEGLADRIPEAEAYADEIRYAQFAAFSDASAGAELTGIGASTRVAVASIKSRLEGQLERAETADEVDQRLGQAEDDARLLLGQMNNALEGVMEQHGLTLDMEDSESTAVALAH